MPIKPALYFRILCLSVFLWTSAVHAENKLYGVFLDPADSSEQLIADQLQNAEALSQATTLINQQFRLKNPIELVFGADDGPAFDPETYQILIPYQFIEEVKQRFVDVEYAETGVSIEDATMDVLMHTLFHEIGHVLIPMFDLPVLGKEEDAVDALATVLLIEFFEGGQEIALSAADLFDLESAERTELEEADFWDEHSLDAQRYYSTLCHVYGSDPDAYGYIKQDAEFSDDRADLCIQEYETTTESWFKVLVPYMKEA